MRMVPEAYGRIGAKSGFAVKKGGAGVLLLLAPPSLKPREGIESSARLSPAPLQGVLRARTPGFLLRAPGFLLPLPGRDTGGGGENGKLAVKRSRRLP